MNIKDVKQGMKVKISMGDCEATRYHCGLTKSMIKLKGEIVTVSKILKRFNIVEIGGRDWYSEDLIDISKAKKKKVEPVLFDEKMVWL